LSKANVQERICVVKQTRLDENLRIACLAQDGCQGLCCHRFHNGRIVRKVIGVSGHPDQIAHRSIGGYRALSRAHVVDARCIASVSTEASVALPACVYQIGFCLRQTRKSKGRAWYQVIDNVQRNTSSSSTRYISLALWRFRNIVVCWNEKGRSCGKGWEKAPAFSLKRHSFQYWL
jgi:hypothetical protein